MKRFVKLLILLIIIFGGCISADASNYGKPLTQYALVDGNHGVATLRSKKEMGRILKSLGFKIVSKGNTFKAVRNGTSVVMTKIRKGDKCVINFATQSEANQFLDSMIKSKWFQYGNNNVYMHPQTAFGGGVKATVSGKIIILIYDWGNSYI